MKKHKLTFPALIDPKGSIKTMYGVIGIPESYIIDKQGILIGKVIGGYFFYSNFSALLLDLPFQMGKE